MGVKVKARLLAVLMAVAMIATSSIGVFAASSPIKGKVSDGSAYATSLTKAKVTWSAKENASYYLIYVGSKKVKKVKATSASTYSVKISISKNSHSVVYVQAVSKSGNKSTKTKVGTLCTLKTKQVSNVKAKASGSKKIKVSWKKAKYPVKGYRIAIYKNGKYWKTVKAGKSASSKTISKLTKGAKYKFVVYALCKKGYSTVYKSTKTVKAK